MKSSLLISTGFLCLSCSVFAGGTVGNLTQGDLETALAGGGTVLFGTNGTLTMTNTFLIAKGTTLDGNGNKVIVSGGNSIRLFQVASNVTFAINGLTLADGRVVAQTGDAFGACIWNQGGNVILTGCALTNNSVQGADGTGGAAFGGAIYTVGGRLSMTNCLMTLNQAVGGMGSPPAETQHPSFGGPAGPAMGGAIYSAGAMVILQAVEMRGNAATGGAAATAPYLYFAGPGGNGFGGHIFTAGNLQVRDSSFSDGRASGGSGWVVAGVGRGGAICSTGGLTMNGCALFENATLGANASTAGFTSPGAPGEGGALWSSGTLACTNSTITACRVLGGSGANSGYGGAGTGGGVYLTNVTALLVNLTVAANRADATNTYPPDTGPVLGGNLATINATVTVLNSIIANSGNGGDVWGLVTDGGYNICSDGTAKFSALGSLNQADPLLAALSDNGGPTSTMALLVGSPARDAIISNFPPTDQRGVARPQGPAADIGAFETEFVGGTAPAIVTRPIAQTVRAGTNITFTVGVSGTKPLYYQWRKDGIPIGGATSSILSLLNVQATNAATYSALVTNTFGNATSLGAMLVVDSTPIILVQPVSVVVSAGAASNFTVVADGPSVTYEWWHESAPVPGGTAATLSIPSASAGAQGTYFVVVSNFVKAVASTAATLSFDSSALNIQVAPKNATVETGYPASFSVVAGGVPPFAYQWGFNGQPIPGATNSSYMISAVTTNFAGTYDVVITNGYRVVSSPTAFLTVTAGPIPPYLVPARFGQSLTLTFNAQAGRTYRVLSSTNFMNWSSIATNTALSAGPLQFVEPIVAGPPVYFRVVTP